MLDTPRAKALLSVLTLKAHEGKANGSIRDYFDLFTVAENLHEALGLNCTEEEFDAVVNEAQRRAQLPDLDLICEIVTLA